MARRRLSLADRAPRPDVWALDRLADEYLAHHRARGSSPATVARYRATFDLFARHLEETGGHPDSRSLNADRIRRFAIWLRESPCRSGKRSAATVHAHLRDVRAWCRWLAAEGYIADPPKIVLPKLPERLPPVMTDEQLARVWGSKYLTGRSTLATRNRALVALMLDTGIRRSECAGIELADLELDIGVVTVTGKGNKQRRVPFSTSVGKLIEEWLAVRGSEPGKLFWLSSSSILTQFRRIAAECGLPRFYPHLLRHHAATVMVRNVADIEAVRRILGHADIETTAGYLALADEGIKDYHRRASPFEAFDRGRKP